MNHYFVWCTAYQAVVKVFYLNGFDLISKMCGSGRAASTFFSSHLSKVLLLKSQVRRYILGGGIAFKTSSGLNVGSGVVRKGKDNIGQMHAKCASLRFIFVDECACVAASTFSDLAESLREGVSSRNSYKLHTEEPFKGSPTDRIFSGVNTFMFGDFYQLPPV